MRSYYPAEQTKASLVSSKYLYYSRKVLPGYYSDLEKAVMMLNRYRSSGDLENVLKWLRFHSEGEASHLIHLMMGIFFLDMYLKNLRCEDQLLIAMNYLSKAQVRFESSEARLAFNGLMAFCHYLHRDFSSSEIYLEERGEFQGRFLQLLKNAA